MVALDRMPALRPGRGVFVLLTVAVVLVTADAALELAAAGPTAYVVLFTLAMAGLAAAAVLVLRNRRHSGLAVLLLLTSSAGALFDLATVLPSTGPVPFLRGVLYWPYAALLAHLLVRWPDSRVQGWVTRGLLLALYALMPVLTVAWQVLWLPRWFGGDQAGLPWWTLLPARDAAYAVWEAQQLLFAVLVVALVAVVLTRAMGARGARRSALVPVTVVAVALGATVALQIAQGLGAVIALDVGLLQSVALLAIPVAVAVATVRAGEEISAQVTPGSPPGPGDRVRRRYHLGGAAVVGLLVSVVVVVVVVREADGLAQVPAPAPGPAVAIVD